MEIQNMNLEQNLQIVLCGQLVKTERALLRRGDVEIIREKKNLRQYRTEKTAEYWQV